MAQLAASIVSHDEEFKRQVSRLLRACGVPVGIVEERMSDCEALAPTSVVVDIRARRLVGHGGDRAPARRAPSMAIFAIASSRRARPDPSGDARRRERVLPLESRRDRRRRARWRSRSTARCAARPRVARRRTAGARQPCVTHVFLGAKGGAGTTTVAVNCARRARAADEAPDRRSSI